ncbi:hypothetical protein BC937DRAFT_92477 [Endogone sp. FLAS-F59071]|nr:hypothetical protein BC937DRAFT_92477 [Endogone sp. FLAS-F59071]|eukprot:RUS21508.1 hypothetical protein BC937DRAFT_92477 [Endogone sp. FLAS-F59071]
MGTKFDNGITRWKRCSGQVAVCDFPSIRDAAAAVSAAVVRAGAQVCAVELLDDVMMKAINLVNPQLGYVDKPTLFFNSAETRRRLRVILRRSLEL